MKLKIHLIPALILLYNLLFVNALYPENNHSGFTYTLSGGPSSVSGYYDRYFKNGYSAGFNTFYSPSLLSGNTYFKAGFAGFHHDMESSKNSMLRQLDFLAGAGFFYPVFSFIDLSAGIDLHGIYSSLNTKNTLRDERAFKPSISYNIGVIPYLGRGIGLFFLYDFRMMELSRKNYNASTFSIGLTYNYNSYVREVEMASSSEKKLTMFNQGLSEFKKKNFNEAKTLFFDLNAIDKNFPGLDYYIKRIEEIELNRTTAETLISQQNYLKAIPQLEGCSAYIKDCEIKLLTHRKALKVNIPKWEADGIKLYDEKKFKECIEIMERILLVDPENKNANIYLPRAVKRQQAIESL